MGRRLYKTLGGISLHISKVSAAADGIALRRWAVVIAVLTAIALALPTLAHSQTQDTAADPASFFKNIAGDWIGTCEQATDGEQADNKYFHAVVKQVNENTFESRFKYYRLDEATRSPLEIGDTTVVSTIGTDGSVKNKIIGNGTILVNEKPKSQEHEMEEVLSWEGNGNFSGKINGKISVNGMPLGLGKNGEIRNATSTWTYKDGILTIDQNLKAGFKVLMFSKNYTVTARMSATRGSDVVGLMLKGARVAAQPAGISPDSL